MAGLKKANANDELNKVVNQIEDEYVRNLNDEVEVDEDGFVHDEPMLAGYVDEHGTLHNTFTYREMNGRDEEAISKADVRQNGAKMVNILVERCVESIGTLTKKDCGVRWGSIVRELLGGDLDYMAFKIRELSKGKEVEFTHKCPSCGTKLTTIVETSEFNIKPYMGQSAIDFTLVRGYKDKKGTHKEGVIRLPNGFDREIVTPLFKKNMSTAMTMLLTRLVSFHDGAIVTQNLVNEMSLRDREILEKIIKENTFGVDTSIDNLTCTSCGQDISGEVGQSNFL